MTASDPHRPGEFELIARYFAPIAGPGGLGLVDDAGLLQARTRLRARGHD